METIVDFATSTGQWPEAIHPRTHGGCMGDGQHVWAAAEWILTIRNCFLREEEEGKGLILCSGIRKNGADSIYHVLLVRPPTSFGIISIQVKPYRDRISVTRDGAWHNNKKPLLNKAPLVTNPVIVECIQKCVDLIPAR